MAASSLVDVLSSKPFQFAKRLIDNSKRLVVISGAGISTDSGIPDYRSPGRPPHKPIQDADFRRYHTSRQRYWARSRISGGSKSFSKPWSFAFMKSYVSNVESFLPVLSFRKDL